MSLLVLPRGLARKTTHEIGVREMAWLADGEDVCRTLGLTIVCLRCLQAGLGTAAVIQGANSGSDEVLRVDCPCRSLQYRAKPDGSA